MAEEKKNVRKVIKTSADMGKFMATDLIPYATAIGYSPEVCSYMTADIGAYLQKTTPLSKAFPGIDHSQ